MRDLNKCGIPSCNTASGGDEFCDDHQFVFEQSGEMRRSNGIAQEFATSDDLDRQVQRIDRALMDFVNRYTAELFHGKPVQPA